MKRLKLIDWLFLGFLFLIFLLPANDPDLGWQLRCGQQIWQGKGFCNLNQFSVLMPNYSWINHRWLYQAIIWPLFQLTGLWGLSFFNALLMSLTFFFFYQAIANYRWEKMMAIGLTIFLGWGVFKLGLRSQLFGFFAFSLLLWLLPQVEKRPKLAIFLPLVTLIWANVHGSVIIGLGLFLFEAIRATIKQPKQFLFWFVIFLLSLATTLINPFGLQIYQDAWQHFATAGLSSLIAEWVPPNKVIWWLILTSCIGLLIFSLFENRLENKIFTLMILPFAFLALGARRHLPFYFLLFFYLFFNLELTKKILKKWRSKKDLRIGLAILTVMLFYAFSLVFHLPATLNTNRDWQNFCQNSSLNYPCGAVEFLKSQPEKSLSGSRRSNIFNRYEWGGFLIWQLPEYQIFVDGRMPAWSTASGKSPYTIYLEALQTRPGWQQTLNDYQIDWILISPGTFMDLLLQPAPEDFGWNEVFRDKISVVYKKL